MSIFICLRLTSYSRPTVFFIFSWILSASVFCSRIPTFPVSSKHLFISYFLLSLQQGFSKFWSTDQQHYHYQELVGNASFWAPPQTYWFRKSLSGGSVSAIWILISLPGDADALKFENHCLTNIEVSAILKKNAFPYLGQVMTLVFLLPPSSAKHLERIVYNLSLFLLLSTHWLMSPLVLLPRSSVTSYCLIRSSFSIFL